MKEELVSLEIAEIAKVKGFNWPTLKAYDKCDMICSYGENIFDVRNYNTSGYVKSAPTQSILQRWLREEKYINIEIHRECTGDDEWCYAYIIDYIPKEDQNHKRRAPYFKDIRSYQESPGGTYWGGWDSYEEALEEALKKSFSLM